MDSNHTGWEAQSTKMLLVLRSKTDWITGISGIKLTMTLLDTRPLKYVPLYITYEQNIHQIAESLS